MNEWVSVNDLVNDLIGLVQEHSLIIKIYAVRDFCPKFVYPKGLAFQNRGV